MTNSSGFSANDYVLLGELGSETSELVQPSDVNTSTHVLTVPATKFAHSESTRATIIKYNQVKFYHTATATFGTGSQVGSTQEIQVDDTYTKEYDTSNTTGFGWFVFYNSTTASVSTNSHAIPYAGFGESSVKKIFDNFYSLLNNKETKLITNTDAFSWLNEAYAITVNELNLVNINYYIEDKDEIATVSGTQEYALNNDFAEIVSVYEADSDVNITKMDITEVSLQDHDSSDTTRYYIRGNYIGFSPVPDGVTNYEVRYKSKSTTLTSLYDNVNIPNNNQYLLIDYMMYRAAPKLNRGDAKLFYEAFGAGIQRLKATAHKRSGGLDSWGMDPQTII